MKDEIQFLKEEYTKKLTKIILKWVRNKEISVYGKVIGFSIYSVSLCDKKTGDSLIELWTENQDEQLNYFQEYGYTPILLEENRKEIFNYVKENLNA